MNSVIGNESDDDFEVCSSQEQKPPESFKLVPKDTNYKFKIQDESGSTRKIQYLLKKDLELPYTAMSVRGEIIRIYCLNKFSFASDKPLSFLLLFGF